MSRRLTRVFPRCAIAAAAVFAVAACSGDAPLSPDSDRLSPLFTEGGGGFLGTGQVLLCKFAPDQEVHTWADFRVSTSPEVGTYPLGAEFRLDAGTTNWDEKCSIVWTPPTDLAEGVTVTIEEIGMPAGMWTEVIVVFQEGLPMSGASGVSSIDIEVGPGFGAVVYFKNRGEPEFTNGGGAGCTPGFWRQAHHYPYWTNYSPGDAWTVAFNDPGSHSHRAGGHLDASTTLGEAVELGGGGIFALARHAVAALLNAASPEVDYNLSVTEIIDLVNTAIASGNFAGPKDLLEGYNEQGCTVDKSN